jgi:hypothetical protein
MPRGCKASHRTYGQPSKREPGRFDYARDIERTPGSAETVVVRGIGRPFPIDGPLTHGLDNVVFAIPRVIRRSRES